MSFSGSSTGLSLRACAALSFTVALATAGPRPLVCHGKRSGRSALSGGRVDREFCLEQVGLASGRVAGAGDPTGLAEVLLRADAAFGVPVGNGLNGLGPK